VLVHQHLNLDHQVVLPIGFQEQLMVVSLIQQVLLIHEDSQRLGSAVLMEVMLVLGLLAVG
jgi:hypothetical protein